MVQAEFTAKNPKQNQNKARMPVQLPEESRELPFKSVFYHVRDPRDVIVNGYRGARKCRDVYFIVCVI